MTPTPTNADDVTVRRAEEIATRVANRCHGDRKPGQAAQRYATIYQAARLGAIEALSAHQSTGEVERMREALEKALEWLNYEEVSRLGPAERKVYDRLMEKVEAALAIKGGE